MISSDADSGSRLSGRVALITGGGGSIGRGIAQRLAQEGATIVIVDSEAASATETLALIERDGHAAMMLQGDVSEKKFATHVVDQAVSRLGRLDILVAASQSDTRYLPLADIGEDSLAAAALGYRATLWMMQAALPHMRARGGAIIALGSTRGHHAQRYIADYRAMSESIRALVVSAAQEWGPYGIRVNLLETAADTPEFRRYRADHVNAVDAAVAQLPLRRMGDPVQDIGGAALFLASDDSRYLTGEVIHADGGEHLCAPAIEPRPDQLGAKL
jgi:NAD(P)-dependent dehydrogenase (short-subunit alcohol dehydrogenase family)